MVMYDIIEPWIIDGWSETYLKTQSGFVPSAQVASHINKDPYVNVSARAASISCSRLAAKGVVECKRNTKGLNFRHLTPTVTASPIIDPVEAKKIAKDEQLLEEIIYGSLLAAKGNKLLAADLLAEVNSHGYDFNSTKFGKMIANKYEWLIKSRNGVGITYQIER